jgi:multidrug efflux pump subunit AcrA (membrane-fusion protein)
MKRETRGPGHRLRAQHREPGTRNAIPVFLALLALLPACHGTERAAVPAPALPELSRPVSTLPARNGAAILLVQDDLLVQRGGLPGVFVLRDGRARFQPVRPGRRTGGNVEVLAGLAGGERLVGGRLAEVRDGNPIRTGAN